MRTLVPYLISLPLAFAGFGCSRQATPPRRPELTIQLRWVQGYPGETKAKVETGMDWVLSFLGASLPGKSSPVYSWRADVVTVDLDAAGVLPDSTGAWISILSTLKGSDEYRRTGAMDMGRFVALTLCSSRQYFALTAAPPTFSDFLVRHPQPRKPAAVIESGIASGNRLLEVGPAGRIGEIFFVAYEGSGSLVDGSFRKAELETIDFMPNGQLRFGLYDLAGHPKLGTTASLTAAGKPSKCLWCHEIGLQQPYKNVTDVAGFYSTAQLRAAIQDRMSTVQAYRSTLQSRVDFRRTNDHTYAELLYLSFAEPSVARLSLEWHLPEERVRALVAGFKTHPQHERPVLGAQLYDREDIDRFAPYQTIRAPAQMRESGGYEPDLLAMPGDSAHEDASAPTTGHVP